MKPLLTALKNQIIKIEQKRTLGFYKVLKTRNKM